MRNDISRLLLGATLLAGLAAPGKSRADDAAQSLDSPIRPGSGLTFRASKDKTTLTVGLDRQIVHTGWFWGGYLEGHAATDDAQSTTILSTTNGVASGVRLKLSIGYSSAAASGDGELAEACQAFLKDLQVETAKKLAASCEDSVEELAAALGVKGAAVGATCKDKLVSVNAAFRAKGGGGFRDSTARALDELMDSVSEDAGATARSRIETVAKRFAAMKSPAAGEKKTNKLRSCLEQYDALEEASPLRKKYASLPDIGRTQFKVALNGIVDVRQQKYNPLDGAGAPILSTTKTWTGPLLGVSLDASIYKGPTITGLQIGWQRTLDLDLEEVCKTTTQGAYSAKDCSKSVFGEPSVGDALYVGAALSVVPIVDPKVLGDFSLGIQPSLRVETATRAEGGTKIGLFEKSSLAYRFGVPIFVVQKDQPWGLRAGLAPEYDGRFTDADKNEFRVVMFVGAKFDEQASSLPR